MMLSEAVKTMLSLIVSALGRVSVSLALLVGGVRLDAQSAGNVDPSFEVGVAETVDGTVHRVIVQPDQNVLVSGEFTVAGGAIRKGIARLLQDGTADPSFRPGLSLTHEKAWELTIGAIFLQPDGKVLVSGVFTHYNEIRRNGLLRLHPDGTLDTSFDPGTGAQLGDGTAGQVAQITLEPDGKILLIGNFTLFQSVPRRGAARLNPDGSLDASFEPDGPIKSFIGSSPKDGKILAVGPFGTVPGAEFVVMRLQANGDLDPTFHMDPAVTGILTNGVMSGALLPGGKILAWGVVTSPYWTPDYIYVHCRLVRLNPDGALDERFGASTTAVGFSLDSPSFREAFSIRSVAVQADGKILIAGPFSQVNDSAGSFLARLEPDGKMDTTFRDGWPDGVVNTIDFTSNGSIIIGGSFTKVVNTSRKRVARLGPNGAFDPSFNADQVGFTFVPLLVQPDGKVLVSATFTTPMGVSSRLARIEPDGSLDRTFAEANHGSGGIAILEPDGNILWNHSPGWNENTLVRLNLDGTRDDSFQLSVNLDFSVRVMARQADGKILLGGYAGANRHPLIRLNPDGSLDPTFTDPGVPRIDGDVTAIVPMPDGKIVIAGHFKTVIGAPWDPIARLNPDGTRDNTFYPNLQMDGGIERLVALPDGKFLIQGSFNSVGAAVRPGLARLNPDGSMDLTFVPGSNVPGPIFSMAAQGDGKILLGGRIDPPTGLRQGSLVRLNPNGTLDDNFSTGVIEGVAKTNGGAVEWIGVQPDGNILIAGRFISIDEIPRMNVARLFGTAVQPVRLRAPRRLPAGEFAWTLLGQPGRSYTVQISPDLMSWFDLWTVVVVDSAVTGSDAMVPGGTRFYRVRAD